MDFGITRVTSDELTEVLDRLKPYLPQQLRTVGSRDGRLYCEFHAFNGVTTEPYPPSAAQSDPRLSFLPEGGDPVEKTLRHTAHTILIDIYERARREWQDVRYVELLREKAGDADALWQTYLDKATALKEAYDFLRDPAASAAWPSALSRLLDAQNSAVAAATAFEAQAEQIARIHRAFLVTDLSEREALMAAGFPNATDWPVADHYVYERVARDFGQSDLPLVEQVRRLVAEQKDHVREIRELSGETAR
jgi:hypothetical protein